MGTSNTRYTAEFKAEAIKQVIERGHPVREVAERLACRVEPVRVAAGVPQDRCPTDAAAQDAAAEIRWLKAELRRVTEERDILKKAAAYFAKPSG